MSELIFLQKSYEQNLFDISLTIITKKINWIVLLQPNYLVYRYRAANNKSRLSLFQNNHEVFKIKLD